ncbi:hypothetical protein E2C01_075281 [Portunus trituberculatus]|uniref:Uncharacterized protein n=1 Tax=Portunus trituberculatus TaxID=210409 RepID=A0A5B7IJP1_PORTR|nr:hypothetical protein [Portunus trituberculatus]
MRKNAKQSGKECGTLADSCSEWTSLAGQQETEDYGVEWVRLKNDSERNVFSSSEGKSACVAGLLAWCCGRLMGHKNQLQLSRVYHQTASQTSSKIQSESVLHLYPTPKFYFQPFAQICHRILYL